MATEPELCHLIFDERILYFQVLVFVVVFLYIKTPTFEAREMAQHLRSFAVLAEDSNLDPSFHIRQLAITHNSSSGGPNTLFWLLKAFSWAHTQTHHIHTH